MALLFCAYMAIMGEMQKSSAALLAALLSFYTKNQLKTIQKIGHNLAYMDYAMIFCL